VFTAVVLIGVAELTRLMHRASLRPSLPWAGVMCSLLMLSPWLCAGEVLGDGIVDVDGFPWHVILLAIAVIGTAVVHLASSVSPGAIANLGTTLLVILYLGFLPSFAILIRSNYNLADPAEGVWILLIILMIVFATDIGALFVGTALGRHRLAPTISPKKSIEGAFGGVAFSVLAALALRGLAMLVGVDLEPRPEATDGRWAEFGSRMLALPTALTAGELIIFAAILSVFSQAGDLFESLLKRCAQAKDSSTLIPGMGGVLDVIDSLLFAMPAAWFLLTRVWEAV
jgi:phosphatidate cytidylyltransferase